MLNFRRLLEERKSPIGVGVVGAGYMGSGVMDAVRRAVGMEVVGVFAPDEAAAGAAVEQYAPGAKVLRLEDLCGDRSVEVVVDGTADPELGARAAMLALQNDKHVISVNVECDATIGHILARRSAERGLVYTATAGDEPGELKVLHDHYDALGFRVVALGKGKNNPLRHSATPADMKASLPDNGITARQVASFVDGSKTMFEMASIGNAVGFAPDVPGMHGPECTLAEIPQRFREKDSGGILSRERVVDFVTGPDISGGVWIVVYSDDPRVRSDFRYLKIGEGPHYLFYQRYHNWFLDTPISILHAALLGMGTVVPRESPTCRVVAVAKRRIEKGVELDGIGGYDTYGRLGRDEESRGALPLGLAKGAKIKRNISSGEAISLADVELPEGKVIHLLWAEGASEEVAGSPDGGGSRRNRLRSQTGGGSCCQSGKVRRRRATDRDPS